MLQIWVLSSFDTLWFHISYIKSCVGDMTQFRVLAILFEFVALKGVHFIHSKYHVVPSNTLNYIHLFALDVTNIALSQGGPYSPNLPYMIHSTMQQYGISGSG